MKTIQKIYKDVEYKNRIIFVFTALEYSYYNF